MKNGTQSENNDKFYFLVHVVGLPGPWVPRRCWVRRVPSDAINVLVLFVQGL